MKSFDRWLGIDLDDDDIEIDEEDIMADLGIHIDEDPGDLNDSPLHRVDDEEDDDYDPNPLYWIDSRLRARMKSGKG